jgi:DNA helicase IV
MFQIFSENEVKKIYETEKKKYLEGIEWKKELHQKHNTKLVTTYSYEHHENTLFENLKKSLLEHKVVFKTISSEEIKEKISDKIKTESSVFNNLVLTFLSLYKSNNLTLEKITQKQQSIFTTKYKKLKSEVFIKIFSLVIERYKKFLTENNAIDFHDMINNATELIQSESVKTPYKYIIIDEFQDIWLWRYSLIKSILEKNDAQLFCVWDDWQSIYRFTGWDLNIFTQFENYFPYWEKIFINKTYRYPQAVNNITHSFITKNKAQINKILESGNTNTSSDVYRIIYYANESEKQKIVYDLKSQYNNIVWLWRTKSDGNICKDIMDFKTVHSAKWLEEDYVVLLNGNSGTTGFPIEIKDSFLLDLVLSESDGYDYSEERRLFYVALTRAKKKTFILTQIGKKSIFVKELEEILWVKETHENQNREICPLCKEWILVMSDKYKKWSLTCNLYPACNYAILTTMPFWKYKWESFSQIPDSYLTWLKNEINGDDTKKEIYNSIQYEIGKREVKESSH